MRKSFDLILTLSPQCQLVAECFNAVKNDSIETHSVTMCCDSKVTQKRFCKGCGCESPKTRSVHRIDAVNSIDVAPSKRNMRRELVLIAIAPIASLPMQCHTGKVWTVRPSTLSVRVYSRLCHMLDNDSSTALYAVDQNHIPYCLSFDNSGIVLSQLRHIDDTMAGFPSSVVDTTALSIEWQTAKPMSQRDKLVAMVQEQLGNQLADQLRDSIMALEE